ncbi:STAS domain-containing protein [Herbidospora sp. RD11066]
MATLTMRSSVVAEYAVVHIDGILDATTREQFSDHLDSVVDDHGSDMILDLGGVTFMDSRALGLIVHHWQRATAAGGFFALVNVQYPASKVMWVTGLAQRLPMFDTVDEAVAAA